MARLLDLSTAVSDLHCALLECALQQLEIRAPCPVRIKRYASLIREGLKADLFAIQHNALAGVLPAVGVILLM